MQSGHFTKPGKTAAYWWPIVLYIYQRYCRNIKQLIKQWIFAYLHTFIIGWHLHCWTVICKVNNNGKKCERTLTLRQSYKTNQRFTRKTPYIHLLQVFSLQDYNSQFSCCRYVAKREAYVAEFILLKQQSH